MGRSDAASKGNSTGGAKSRAKQAPAKRSMVAQKEQSISTATVQEVTETVMAALAKARAKRKRRKRRSAKRHDPSSSDSSSDSSSSDENPDAPSTSKKAAKKLTKVGAAAQKPGGARSEKGERVDMGGDGNGRTRRKPPRKKQAPGDAPMQLLSDDGVADAVATTPRATLVGAPSAKSASASKTTEEDDGDEPTVLRRPSESPITIDTDSAANSPAPTKQLSSTAAADVKDARSKSRKAKERTTAAPKPLSYCGDVPLAHLGRSFVLPLSLVDRHDLDAFVVLGETQLDPEFALLPPSRAVLPDLDKLDGLVNLSRLTQAERYSYVRRLISAAQWDPRLRQNVRLCMIVNARSLSDVFYLVLRSFDVALLVDQKTPVDNLLTQLYNYLELLFVQRWFLMRPGKLTNTELAFYGQRGENFKKYVRYVELFFARPVQFHTILQDILEAGVVSGQAVAVRVLEVFGAEESNLKAWYAMQQRANWRANSSLRYEMDMIPDADKSWLVQDDAAAQVLSDFTRSFNDAQGTATAHWLDTYPVESTLEPHEFTRLMHLCHSAIYRKIHTNKALSVSARRLTMHLAEAVKCSDYVSVSGPNKAVGELAAQLGNMEIDAATLDLATANSDSWSAKVRLVRYEDDADTSTAICLDIPIENTATFKEFMLNVVYSNFIAENQTHDVVAETSGREGAVEPLDVPSSSSTAAAAPASPSMQPAPVAHSRPSIPAPTDEALATAAMRGQTAAVVLTPTRLLSLTGRDTIWTTRALRYFWESPIPSPRHSSMTMLFFDDGQHDMALLRSNLHHDLAGVINGDLGAVENDLAATLLHETAEAYTSVRPLDVVVTVADGFWQPAVDALEHYTPVKLCNASGHEVNLVDVRCLAGFSTVAEQRVLIVAFRPAGIYVTPHAIGPHCTVIILGCLDDNAALQQAFVAAQIQLARTLSKSAHEMQHAHWMGANCLALSVLGNELEEEAANVVLTQQFLRLLYFSTISTGPALRLSLLEEFESGNAFLRQVYARLDRTLLISTIPLRSPVEDQWQADIERAVTTSISSSIGADAVDVDAAVNEQTAQLALRTLLLHARGHPEAGAYLRSGRMSTEFGAASTPLLQAHQREIATSAPLRDCVEFRTLTLHGFIPLGITPSAWFFTDEGGTHFVYSLPQQQFWRNGVALSREELLTQRAVNLPYM